MNNLILYLIQSSLSLSILYIFYWLLWRKDTHFLRSRIYLIMSVLVAMCLPLIHINIPIDTYDLSATILLESVIIGPDNISESLYNNMSTFQILGSIYLAGVIIFTFRFLYQIFRIVLLIEKFGIIRKDGLSIVSTNKQHSPFSFFNLVFLGKEVPEYTQLEKIISHEKVHIDQMHSLDRVIVEIITIVQWYNPFVWLFKSAIKNVHEYIADEGVLTQGIDRKDYQELLINQTLGIPLNGISNNFSHSLIKRRLLMMSKSKTNRYSSLKMVFIVPLTLILFFLFSFTFNDRSISQENVEEKKIVLLTQSNLQQEEEVVKVPEKMPKFPGGDKAFQKFMSENIKYPEEARKKGISGIVYVTFVIEKDGSVSNVKLLRGIGGGCDEESLRVVSILPNYEPGLSKGKPVRTEFNVPIRFELDSNKEKDSEAQIEKSKAQIQKK